MILPLYKATAYNGVQTYIRPRPYLESGILHGAKTLYYAPCPATAHSVGDGPQKRTVK